MIAFRADGNSKVGMGHVMRCLSIADAFSVAGESCVFLLADDGLRELIKTRGHEVYVLETSYDLMEEEETKVQDAISKMHVNKLFLDSYYVTDAYLRSLHSFCALRSITLVYMDDVLAFPYECDVLINYNIYSSEKMYKSLYSGKALPRLLIGTSYAPLRFEFQNLPKRVVKKDACDVLVSTGGADTEHIGLSFIKVLRGHKEWNKYQFHLLLGAMNVDKQEIKSLVMGLSNIHIHENVTKMAQLMQACDVAISAAGSTLFELCATQTPTITYVLADNQISGAEEFKNQGILQNIGDVRELGVDVLVDKAIMSTVKLLSDYKKRVNVASQMEMFVDGKGADRIAVELL